MAAEIRRLTAKGNEEGEEEELSWAPLQGCAICIYKVVQI